MQITYTINVLYLFVEVNMNKFVKLQILLFIRVFAIYTVMMLNRSYIYLLDHAILCILWCIYGNIWNLEVAETHEFIPNKKFIVTTQTQTFEKCLIFL